MTHFDDRERNDEFWRLNRWGSPILGILIIVLALMGIAASHAEPTAAVGESCVSEDCNEASHEGWGHSDRGHRLFGRRGHDPERAREHLQYAAGWMLERLDVDDAAQERIQDRLDSAFVELLPMVEEHKNSRHTWLDSVLGAGEIDRAALESRRQSAIASADRASLIVTDAVADVAEMLTPEQRAELAEKIRGHHH